ncbi:MAG: hypothetical protein M1831_001984 [Alyxoria varia]|nr:MAG: hypothetical protein M1831_001984 [Alyxoria varia]
MNGMRYPAQLGHGSSIRSSRKFCIALLAALLYCPIGSHGDAESETILRSQLSPHHRQRDSADANSNTVSSEHEDADHSGGSNNPPFSDTSSSSEPLSLNHQASIFPIISLNELSGNKFTFNDTDLEIVPPDCPNNACQVVAAGKTPDKDGSSLQLLLLVDADVKGHSTATLATADHQERKKARRSLEGSSSAASQSITKRAETRQTNSNDNERYLLAKRDDDDDEEEGDYGVDQLARESTEAQRPEESPWTELEIPSQELRDIFLSQYPPPNTPPVQYVLCRAVPVTSLTGEPAGNSFFWLKIGREILEGLWSEEPHRLRPDTRQYPMLELYVSYLLPPQTMWVTFVALMRQYRMDDAQRISEWHETLNQELLPKVRNAVNIPENLFVSGDLRIANLRQTLMQNATVFYHGEIYGYTPGKHTSWEMMNYRTRERADRRWARYFEWGKFMSREEARATLALMQQLRARVNQAVDHVDEAVTLDYEERLDKEEERAEYDYGDGVWRENRYYSHRADDGVAFDYAKHGHETAIKALLLVLTGVIEVRFSGDPQ